MGSIATLVLPADGDAVTVDVTPTFNGYSDPAALAYSITRSPDASKAVGTISGTDITITPKGGRAMCSGNVHGSKGNWAETWTFRVSVKQANRAPTAQGTISPRHRARRWQCS